MANGHGSRGHAAWVATPASVVAGDYVAVAIFAPMRASGYHPTQPWRTGDGDRNGSHAACYKEPCLAHTARNGARMDPSTACCPNLACPDKGQQGHGTSGIHSQKEQRYRCKTCRSTFAATRGTAFYRVRHPVELLVLVVTLVCHGCPTQAIVAAFRLDERTVAAWLHRTGTHAAQVHTAVVETGQVEVGQVQADEICVKVCKGWIWQALALAGGARTAVAGRGPQPDTRRRPGRGDAAARGRLRRDHGPLALCRRVRGLCEGSAHGVPGAGAHRATGSPALGLAGDDLAGAGGQEPQRAGVIRRPVVYPARLDDAGHLDPQSDFSPVVCHATWVSMLLLPPPYFWGGSGPPICPVS